MHLRKATAALTTPAPRLSNQLITDILLQVYGINGETKTLVSERDQNVLITEATGQKALLKIANAAEHISVTEFQVGALLHVEATDPTFPIPRIRRTRKGNSHATVFARNGVQHVVRLQSWLEGIPLAAVPAQPDISRELGRLLARLDRALATFLRPDCDYTLLWDLQHAAMLTELLSTIQDQKLRNLCRQWLERFVDVTSPAIQGLRRQVIYNDLNPSNLLVDPDDPARIFGIIDFGDMVYSPLVVDVAVGAAYLCRADVSSLSQVEQFVSAFNAQLPLGEDEIDILYELIMIRHVMTVIITHWRAMRYPDNRKYILRNEPRARQTLESLGGMRISDVASRFRAACRSH
jgi:Ser/Thr protein kinase RdoA (MazF antagonist)